MKAGNLNRRIEILSPVAARDTTGDDVRSWVRLTTVWAWIQPLTAREILLARQLERDETHRITIRYRGDISTNNRLRYGGKGYDITSVQDTDGSHKRTVLIARELPNA